MGKSLSMARTGKLLPLAVGLTVSTSLLAGCSQIQKTVSKPYTEQVVYERTDPQTAGGAAPPQMVRSQTGQLPAGGTVYRSALASLADNQARTLAQQTAPTAPAQIDASDMIAAVAANRQQQVQAAVPVSAPVLPQVAPGQAAQPQLQALPANNLVAVAAPQQSLGGVIAAQRDVSQVIGMMLSGEEADVRSFYQSRNNKPAWYADNGWSPNALTAHATLQNSLYDGLPNFRYGPIVNQALPVNGLPADVARAELALTRAMVKYMVDLRDGLADSARGKDGRLLLAKAVAGQNLTASLDALRPKNRHYVALANAVKNGKLTAKQRGTALVNMERFRKWRPPHSGRYIQVNLPSQQLYGFDSANVSLRMPVIVGQLSRQTPILSDRITNLKFSPDWTVPSSIAKKDILPILKAKGAAGVANMNLRARRNGKYVDMASVNWSKASAGNYQFYQPPGPNNALGGVRFSLTNSRGIYLHDTPDRTLFNAPRRVISSGCVRVGDAPELASWLLKGQGWGKNKVLDAMNKGRTNTVNLNRSVPVEFTYYTAYAAPDGTVKFWGDVYGMDRELAGKLGI